MHKYKHRMLIKDVKSVQTSRFLERIFLKSLILCFEFILTKPCLKVIVNKILFPLAQGGQRLSEVISF